MGGYHICPKEDDNSSATMTYHCYNFYFVPSQLSCCIITIIKIIENKNIIIIILKLILKKNAK